MAEYGFTWDQDTLTPALGKMDDAADRFLTAVIGFHEPQAEAYAKTNAKWTDRTSNARNGLFARAERDRPNYRIIVGHAVPYGIWLETRWSGRYAILEPTVRAEGKNVMKTVQKGFWAGIISGV